MTSFIRPLAAVAIAAWATQAPAQERIDLARARAAARQNSAELIAARAALDAARGRARQAGAFLNPVVGYNREQTGASGTSSSQDIVALDQAIEGPGVRSARRDAARFRLRAAEASVRIAEGQRDLEVTRAFAQAVAADRRAILADQVARAFAAAAATSERRLREGDVSGLAARRIRLEAARYAALRAEAFLARSTARLTLATLAVLTVDSATALGEVGADAIVVVTAPTDSLVTLALRSRSELTAATLEIDAARAEARLAARERLPVATLTVGSKTEETTTGERLNGLVAGVSLPLPVWDRRGGAVAASEAETRRRDAELIALRRQITREVREAAEGLRSVQQQLGTLDATLQADAQSALRSAQVAYAEGELTLLEWLDTVRAYYETETSIANLRAQLLVRAATLQWAIGTNVLEDLR